MSGLKHGDQPEYFLLNMPMGYDGTGIKHFEPEFRAGSGETEGYQGDFWPGFGGSYLLVLGTWCCRLLWDEEWHGGWDPRWFFRVTWLGCVTCGISRLWHKGKFGKRPHFLTSPNYWECQEYIISKYFFFSRWCSKSTQQGTLRQPRQVNLNFSSTVNRDPHVVGEATDQMVSMGWSSWHMILVGLFFFTGTLSP